MLIRVLRMGMGLLAMMLAILNAWRMRKQICFHSDLYFRSDQEVGCEIEPLLWQWMEIPIGMDGP